MTEDLANATPPERDRMTRWRLVLGGGEADGTAVDGTTVTLTDDDRRRDEALAALYEEPGKRGAGLGSSAPRVARWLGDIRGYFPSSVVKVMQTDAMTRLGLRSLLLEREMLETVQPDIGLVATLMGLGRVIPEESRETARTVVRATWTLSSCACASPA